MTYELSLADYAANRLAVGRALEDVPAGGIVRFEMGRPLMHQRRPEDLWPDRLALKMKDHDIEPQTLNCRCCARSAREIFETGAACTFKQLGLGIIEGSK